jgi:hypothetical protein
MILPFLSEEAVPEGWAKFDGSFLDHDVFNDLWNLLYSHKDKISRYWEEMGGKITFDDIIMPAPHEDEIAKLLGWPSVPNGTVLAIKGKRTVISAEDEALFAIQRKMRDARESG